MRKRFLFILLCLNTLVGYSQNESEVDSIRMYLLEWTAKRPFGVGMHHFKKHYDHYFETNLIVEIKDIFYDYDDCINKLNTGKNIKDAKKMALLNAMVEFQFTYKSILKVFFDIEGNYYFDKKCYKMHNDLYYVLFRYFSNIIIPEKILKKAKENYKGGIWSEE